MSGSGVTYRKQCKVCNSKFRTLIESLHNQNMSPQKIYEHLQNLSDVAEQVAVQQEDINPSSIRRHMERHFNIAEGAIIKVAETQSRIQQSRDSYKQGVQIVVDKINTLSHLVEINMVHLEEAEDLIKEINDIFSKKCI